MILEDVVVLVGDRWNCYESVRFVADIVVAGNEMNRVSELCVDPSREFNCGRMIDLGRKRMDDIPEMNDERCVDAIAEVNDELVSIDHESIRRVGLDVIFGKPDVRIGYDDESEAGHVVVFAESSITPGPLVEIPQR